MRRVDNNVCIIIHNIQNIDHQHHTGHNSEYNDITISNNNSNYKGGTKYIKGRNEKIQLNIVIRRKKYIVTEDGFVLL